MRRETDAERDGERQGGKGTGEDGERRKRWRDVRRDG